MDSQELRILAWMDQLDATLLVEVEMDHTKLPDQCFWDCFETGIPPREAAIRTIENALSE